MTTPVRAALVPQSFLVALVKDGLRAVEKAHLGLLEDGIRASFADSLDLDKALQKGHESENRWDYLLGYEASGQVFGLEPHSAQNHEVSTVIKKRSMALDQLRGHLKPGARVTDWFWVASGKVDFLPIENARLASKGIRFVEPGSPRSTRQKPRSSQKGKKTGGKKPAGHSSPGKRRKITIL